MLSWLNHEIQILGTQKYDMCNIQSKMCDNGISILLKSIQKSAPSSNSSLKAALNNAVGNGEHRCSCMPESRRDRYQPTISMLHDVQDTKIATWCLFLEALRVLLDKRLGLTPAGHRVTPSLSAHLGDAACYQLNKWDPKMACMAEILHSHRTHT